MWWRWRKKNRDVVLVEENNRNVVAVEEKE